MRYIPDAGALVTSVSGIISLNEWFEHNQRVAAALRANPVRFRAMDLRGLVQTELHSDDIWELARSNRRVMDSFPVNAMLVLAVNDLQYGLCRMWEAFADLDSGLLHIFRTCMDACKWLKDVHNLHDCLFHPHRD